MSKSFNLIAAFILISIVTIPVISQTRVGKFGVGVDGSMQYALGGGTVTASPGVGYGASLSYSIMEYLGLRSKFGINQIGWETSTGRSVITDLMSLNFYLTADLMPNSNFNIFLAGGGGLAFYDPKDSSGFRPQLASGISSFDMHGIGGIGCDYFINEFWSITLMAEYVMTGSQYYVGSKPITNDKDSFLRGSLQLRYYFFDQAFITKLLEAQRERSKRNK